MCPRPHIYEEAVSNPCFQLQTPCSVPSVRSLWSQCEEPGTLDALGLSSGVPAPRPAELAILGSSPVLQGKPYLSSQTWAVGLEAPQLEGPPLAAAAFPSPGYLRHSVGVRPFSSLWHTGVFLKKVRIELRRSVRKRGPGCFWAPGQHNSLVLCCLEV